jgi:plastocyanin
MIRNRVIWLSLALSLFTLSVILLNPVQLGLASNTPDNQGVDKSQKDTFCRGVAGAEQVAKPALLSYLLHGHAERSVQAALEHGLVGLTTSRPEGIFVSPTNSSNPAVLAPRIAIAAQTIDVDVSSVDGDKSFGPSVVAINVGDSVRWTFQDGGHNVVSGSNCIADNKFCNFSDANCNFNPNGAIGTTYTHVFNTPGTFNYFCRPHCSDGMTGVVIVQAGGSPTPTPTPTPSGTPSIQLSAGSYNASESDATITVTVTRTGDSSAAASVSYTTSDAAGSQSCGVFNGFASARCDYISSLGTLNFAAGETSKTVLVHIVDDSYAERTESFSIGLSAPVGAVLGSPSTATLTITDNETANGTNSIDNTSLFVRQQYLDFLNREPDPPGFSFWMNEITSCGSDQACIEVKRVNTSGAFYLSIEFQQTGYLVERLYKTSYGALNGASTLGSPHTLSVPIIRLSEFLSDTQRIGQGVIVGQGDWQTVLENNKQAFCAEFVQRSRFATAFPTTMAPADLVDALNVNAGNVLSASERTTAINFFAGAGNTANSTARAQALRFIAEDPDLFNAETNRAFVLMQYFGYLRRNPNDTPDSDYTGYDFWLQKLNAFNGDFLNAEMVKAFLTSLEYRQRFGP